MIIRNNLLYNVTDEGIELKPGTHDILVEGNILYNIMTDPDFGRAGGAIELNEATINCPNCPGGKQTWPSNPNHIIRNNVVHTTRTGIRAGTGSLIYNNVVYNITEPFYGILANNNAADTYTRIISHNTVDVPVNRAIVITSGLSDVKNNIGPLSANNLPSNTAFFVNAVSDIRNYHLVSGSGPIDAGVAANITTDKDGNIRPHGGGYDIGAYEYVGTTTMLNDNLLKEQIKIFPNPTRDKLYFENTSREQLSMNADIYNALGEKLLNKNIDLKSEKMMDVSALSPGIYFVQLSTNSSCQNSRIIIAY